jgi:hypothetical protein
MMRPLLSLILCCLLSPVAIAEEAQLATVLRQTPLQAEPFSDADKLTTLQAKQQVTIMQRKGGWYQVHSAAITGWLRMSHVRFGDGKNTPQNGAGLDQTLRFLSTGRSGADGVTVATGIRGLDAADIANARPDHKALARLNDFQVEPGQAKEFAAGALLKSQSLRYFKEK